MNNCQGSCSGGSCEQSGECRLPPGMLAQYDLNSSTAEGLMIWLEVFSDTSIERSSLEVLSKAREIYDGRIFGVMFGDIELKPLYKDAFMHGIDTLYHVKDSRLKEFSPEAYSNALKEISERVVPAVILMSSTQNGNELAVKLAGSLGACLATDCVDLSMNGPIMCMTRYAEDGNETITNFNGTFPQMATIRPGSFKISDAKGDGKGTVIYWQYRGTI